MGLAKLRGARGIVPLIALLTLGAGIAGCSGDDGKDGAAGPSGGSGATGPVGPTGPAGSTGATGPSAKVEPRESCGVCHDDGSAYGVAEMHALAPQVAVSNIVIAQGTTDPTDIVVTFNVKADGVNYTALTTAARKYQFNGTLRNTIDTIDATVPGDVAVPVVFTPGTNGNYTITLDGGFTQFGAIPSRYAFRIEGLSGTPRAMVMGDFPSSPDESLVSSAGCSGCHGTMGNGFHYGYPLDAKTCTVCHDATNTTYPRLVAIGHGIHNSHNMPGGEFQLKDTLGGDVEDPYSATYPTYMTNCSVCHTDSSGALAKVNEMPVTGEGCLSCHGSMESWDFAASGTTFHEAMDASTPCMDCHKAGGVAADLVKVTDFHDGVATERGGVIWAGVDTSVVEGDKIDMQITNIVDNGTTLAISWTAAYAGAPVNPCNATPAAGAPAFFAIPALPAVPPATNATNRNNMSMLRSYAQGDDFIIGFGTSPGQPAAVNLSTTNTTCSGNTATTSIPVDASIAAGGRGIVALQGKPWVPAVNPADTDGVMQVRALTPTSEFVVGTGALPAEQRRPIADTSDCVTCHVGSLYQHGGNRVDNVDMCVMCHNSAANEQNVRAGMSVDSTDSYDGLNGQTYEFKTMLHAIHSSGNADQKPIVIYRSNGIYAWAPDVTLLRNWPGTGSLPVFGSADANGNPVLRTHNFHTPTYPRAGNDCAACHVPGFDTVPNQDKAVATTLDAGAAPWTNQLDDTLQGASAAACTSCHSSTDAKGHAYQNGWVPATFENGRQTIIDTN